MKKYALVLLSTFNLLATNYVCFVSAGRHPDIVNSHPEISVIEFDSIPQNIEEFRKILVEQFGEFDNISLYRLFGSIRLVMPISDSELPNCFQSIYSDPNPKNSFIHISRK
ncbi:hypothetical protein A3F66_01750 [candidate division TM6 bacterium RIFCSPHIGHO2_12_FULL_32_22]|nr:MAG: hypothetical protein A3F66_01750 [candidate division TM6 bacterium RIFCSPHIGHO2_12_FULL_32_22]